MTQSKTDLNLYRVCVYSQDGEFRLMECSGTSLDLLRAELVDQGMTLVSAEIITEGKRRRRTTRFPILVFCQQLLSLLDAGLQLVEAVDTLVENEQDAHHHRVLVQLQSSLRSGQSFSQALQAYPEIFSPLFQAAISASEQTGGVAQALKRFVAYETKFHMLRSRMIGALIYPVLLLSLGGLVIAFLLGYVVPRFSVVFIDRLQDMPYLSGLVIRLGLSIADNPMKAGLISLGVLTALVFSISTPSMRNWFVGAAVRIPWIGERIRTFELVRIYRSLGMLLQGGIAAVKSLQMIEEMAPLRSRQGINRAIVSVSEGWPISVALHREGLSTAVCDRLLAVGERSGQMGDMLERAADFLDSELERSIDRAVRLMEPLMMIVIGIIIGAIVMLMYLPIFELADSVG